MLGIRKDWVEKRCKFEGEVERMMRSRLRIGGEKWWVIGVYVSGGIKRVLEGLERWVGTRGGT